jgi:hypothetical protein
MGHSLDLSRLRGFYLEGMPMSQKIGLYHDSTWHGEVELDTVFVMEPADYTCEPKGLVTYDEVRQIAKVLRRGPDKHSGAVGSYYWLSE